MRDGEACVSPMCLLDSFEDKLGLWDIGGQDRMLGPGWGLVPRVRTGTAKVRIPVRKDEICLTVRGGAKLVHEEVRVRDQHTIRSGEWVRIDNKKQDCVY